MNNQIPFFNPYIPYPPINNDNKEYDILLNKIERMEKNIQVLETKVRNLEQRNKVNLNNIDDEPTDMYII